MTNWRKQIDLADAWRLYDTKGFMASRDAAVVVLEKELPELPTNIIGRLKRARTERGFNNALDEMWDWADANRVWIQTF